MVSIDLRPDVVTIREAAHRLRASSSASMP